MRTLTNRTRRERAAARWRARSTPIVDGARVGDGAREAGRLAAEVLGAVLAEGARPRVAWELGEVRK